MKALLWLYPPGWRARYHREVATLLEELPADQHVAVDLFRGAIGEWARTALRRIPESPLPAGGPPTFFRPFDRHPATLAVVGFILVAPTATFAVLSVLAYQLGFVGLRATIEPALQALAASRVVDLFLLLAPLIGLVVALAPLVGIGLSRAGAEVRLTLAFHARALNLVVIVVCVAVGGLLAGHIVIESLLKAA